MSTRCISLTQHLDRFVTMQVQRGRYQHAGEVVCAGLRLLEQRVEEEKAKLELLRVLAKKAFDELDQGRGIQLDRRRLARFIAKTGRRANADA